MGTRNAAFVFLGILIYAGWHSSSRADSSFFPAPKTPDNLAIFIRDVKAAIQLGKTFFWDMQAGSDGKVACATCHHAAFSDHRVSNQIAPGPNRLIQSAFFIQKVQPENFPMTTDDIFGSQGVIKARFKDIVLGKAEEDFEIMPDPIFTFGGKNIRQVTSFNSPTVINAVLNHRNFWDGRANPVFNGVTPFGAADPRAEGMIWKQPQNSLDIIRASIRIDASSAASQAVGPALDDVEMSYHGRSWPKLAKKLFYLRPLAKQTILPTDSVLGDLSSFPNGGLNKKYQELISKAFQPDWWNSSIQFEMRSDGKPFPIPNSLHHDKHSTNTFSLMEVNFSLFWGLAIQMYESTLISDQTPFDQILNGIHVETLSPQARKGMRLFNGKANCVSCHGETLLTTASYDHINKLGVSISLFQADQKPAFLDTGFFNIGVRPTEEHLGLGGHTPFNTPLSFSKVLHPEERLAVDGAFKAPGLRNVALTGPYFHNGGKLTLEQVLDFYRIKGDFSDLNSDNINMNLLNVSFDQEDQKNLEAFLKEGLTDPRVANESAPFDHPSLVIPSGYSHKGRERYETIPAVGNQGRIAEGLPVIKPFLSEK